MLNVMRRGRQAVQQFRYMVRQRQQKKRDIARSAQEIFSEVYEKNLWGGAKGEMYSGSGSRFAPAELYAETITKFIKDHSISTVLDLGCGDFEIGKKIAAACNEYIGVDVVPELIARNSQLYANDHIRFICADITQEKLPHAELCLIRQVFQHISNQEIFKVLIEVRKYPYLIVTEHHPHNPSGYNKDIVHGSRTRVEARSGVYLDMAPFNARNLQLLLETTPMVANGSGEPKAVHDWGLIRTFQVTL
jgi:SAM-dependent methyltransferase